MELCPPQAIVPENISSTFNRLRELAFPALMDNIQSHTEGLNQVCILDTDSREALVLIIEPNHYTITWDGVTMMYSYDIAHPQAGSAISDTVLLSSLDKWNYLVRMAEDKQFREWFTLWEPWHKVIERIAPEICTEISTEKNRIVETGEFIARVSDELRLPDRSDDIAVDATAGVKVMRELNLRLFNSATERVLAKTDQEHLLKPQWA